MAPKRLTSEDKKTLAKFKARVAVEFGAAQKRAEMKGDSMEKFAASLGVSRMALWKYLKGKAVPSLPVLRRARRFHGINLPYGDLALKFPGTKREDPRQMKFQFSIADVTKETFEVKKFTARADGSAELLLAIDFSKRRRRAWIDAI